MGDSIRAGTGQELVSAQAQLELVRAGFGFTEGPVWADDAALIFSDIAGDQMWRWDESDGFTSFRQPSHKANGNALDNQGRLLTCEHATSRLVRQEADGSISVLATSYQGSELNSPNDVVVDRHDNIYFTDPTYGRDDPFFGLVRPVQLGFRGLYRLPPDGRLELLASDFSQPNGLCFSADGRALYVNDTERMHIRAFAVSPACQVTGGEVWAETVGTGPGAPDGMKIDVLGNVYCAGPGGIHVFGTDGGPLGLIAVPDSVGNFAWGGADGKTLFVCAGENLYRLRTEVAGHLGAKAA